MYRKIKQKLYIFFVINLKEFFNLNNPKKFLRRSLDYLILLYFMKLRILNSEYVTLFDFVKDKQDLPKLKLTR